jgi:acyl-ACP thioesterase
MSSEEVGRHFSTSRRVRLGDADENRHARLDAIVRYLQDVATDDSRDAGFDPVAPWVVRRTSIEVVEPPVLDERITLTTSCGGLGSRWAERVTTIRGESGGHVDTSALWVYVDPDTGQPARLSERFLATYEEAAAGRKANARLGHGAPATDATSRPWPLRAADLDLFGHVNNAAVWEAVEDEVRRFEARVARAEVEHRRPIPPTDDLELLSNSDASGSLSLWLSVDDEVCASAVVSLRS